MKEIFVVHQYNPPPNFVKEGDTRTSGYRDRFGTDECWELDALEPTVIVALVRDELDSLIDPTACRRVAVRWRAICVVPEGQCPHPGRSYGRGGSIENAADNRAFAKHVKIIVVPLAGRARGGRAFKDQRSDHRPGRLNVILG
jgi:hypothetical protein